MILQCGKCKKHFADDEVVVKKQSMEDFYGVGGDFSNHNYQNIGTCPFCGSDDIEELDESEIIERLNKKAETIL